MGGGPQSSSQSSSTTTEPNSVVKPYLQDYLKLGQNTLAPNNQITDYPYPFQQVAPFSGMQMGGMDMISAMGGRSPLVDQAMATQSGQMANPNAVDQGQLAGGFGNAMNMQNNIMGQNAIQNPLLSQYFNQAAGDVMGQMNSAAVHGGAFGSSGAQDVAGKTLNNLATQMYMPAWNQQEQLRQQAANYFPQAMNSMLGQEGLRQQASYMSPYLMQSSYFPAQMLMNAGGQQQQQAQNILNTGYQNQYAQQGWPFDVLQMLQQVIGAGQGLGSSSTTNVKMKS